MHWSVRDAGDVWCFATSIRLTSTQSLKSSRIRRKLISAQSARLWRSRPKVQRLRSSRRSHLDARMSQTTQEIETPVTSAASARKRSWRKLIFANTKSSTPVRKNSDCEIHFKTIFFIRWSPIRLQEMRENLQASPRIEESHHEQALEMNLEKKPRSTSKKRCSWKPKSNEIKDLNKHLIVE